jgi:hypothetical protein
MEFKNKSQVFKNINVVLVAYILMAVLGSLVEYMKGVKVFEGVDYTHHNNYLIFKHAFYNLIEGKDLYALYPNLFWDYFKYSPTFALLMAPLAVLPDVTGLVLWNLLNALVLFLAVKCLPLKDEKTKVFILWFIAIELLTSIQNSQSNGLMAGLLVFSFAFFERRNVLVASLFIVLSFYLKIFGIAAAVLFLLYPDKLKFVASSVFWTIVLGLLPLTAVSPEQLTFLYKSWANLLASDHTVSYGLSVMGILQSWFHLTPPKLLILGLGTILLLLPFLKVRSYRDLHFRYLLLASLLIWVIIFNHKAESPTYIIAMTGVAIWYFTQPRRTANLLLLIVALVVTSLSPTDLMPRYFQHHFFSPYNLKALPVILVWLKIQYDVLKYVGNSVPSDFIFYGEPERSTNH